MELGLTPKVFMEIPNLNKYTIEKYSPFYEKVKEVALFMGEPEGKWLKRLKGMKPYDIDKMLEACNSPEVKNKRAYFNGIMNKK